jgi:hypothetical protein
MNDTKHNALVQTTSEVLRRSTLYLHHCARDESKEEL